MKILLLRKTDRKFLNNFGGWTSKVSEAREFESGMEVLKLALSWCELGAENYAVYHHFPGMRGMDLEGGEEVG